MQNRTAADINGAVRRFGFANFFVWFCKFAPKFVILRFLSQLTQLNKEYETEPFPRLADVCIGRRPAGCHNKLHDGGQLHVQPRGTLRVQP